MSTSHNHNHAHGSPDHHSNDEQRALLSTSNNKAIYHQDDPQVQQSDNVLGRLQLATCLCITFLIVEAVGGWIAGSLAILSDAAHLLADLAAFLVAMGAAHLASLPSTEYHTFGLKRMESLAALFSMVSLALVSVGLAAEAIRRLVYPPSEPIDGKLMSGIAAIGVLVNVCLAVVLGEHHVHMPGAAENHDHSHNHGHSHDHSHNDDGENDKHAIDEENTYGTLHADEVPPEHDDNDDCHDHHSHDHASTSKKERNVNLQAAYLHVLGDLAQSAAVLIAGLVIWVKPEWHIVDPICTLLFCALVFYSTLGVVRSSIAVLLQEVPPNVSWKAIHAQIQAVPGVWNVHDLHIWSISQGVPSLSVHVMAENSVTTAHEALRNVAAVCARHGIYHATIQVQCQGEECITCASGSGIGTGGASKNVSCVS